MWYRQIHIKYADKRGCTLLTQPTVPVYFLVFKAMHPHGKMAPGFGNDHDIKHRNEMLHP